MTSFSVSKSPLIKTFIFTTTTTATICRFTAQSHKQRTLSPPINLSFSLHTQSPLPLSVVKATTATAMEGEQTAAPAINTDNPAMTLLFVEMGVGYDQHGQDITSAAMRACRDAIASNSIPAFRRGVIYFIDALALLRRIAIAQISVISRKSVAICGDPVHDSYRSNFGSIPGVSFDQMKLQIKLGVPKPVQHLLDIERVKSIFPYGKILNVGVVDGGLICSSGVHVEEMGDKNDDCYIVNAAVYVGY
ncbi:hypothetical protein GIB67_030124 [Kingdonia uniflora]|uniref:Uncharacterized protein n=1 Tax=Kingdonia uniflora TaxID=39325 RepID=A0A7J7L2M8_9MAGN|nr:hypothetical protein GIB67_030124 [Kingdonia uniflora]